MEITAWDKVIRTVLVHVGLLVLIRLLGRRILAQMDSIDLVLVLLLSNVVQNAIIGPDNSVVGGLIGAVVLVLTNQALDRWAQHSPRIMEGSQTVLISDGARW